MQHLEGSGTSVLYIGSTFLKVKQFPVCVRLTDGDWNIHVLVGVRVIVVIVVIVAIVVIVVIVVIVPWMWLIFEEL